MSGMLAALIIAKRRTANNQCDCKSREQSSHHQRAHKSTPTDLSVLEARRRLEEKILSSNVGGSRRISSQKESRSSNCANQPKATNVGIGRLENWLSKLQRQNSKREVCCHMFKRVPKKTADDDDELSMISQMPSQ